MLDRIKNIQVNYAILCSLAYLVKTMVIPASFADSIILVCLFSLVGFQKFLKFKEPKVTPLDLYKEEMAKAIKILADQNLSSQKQIKELTTSISNVSSKLNISGMVKTTETRKYF